MTREDFRVAGPISLYLNRKIDRDKLQIENEKPEIIKAVNPGMGG